MSSTNELWLSGNILVSVRIPMMPSPGDEKLGMQVRIFCAGCAPWPSVCRVVAQVEPYVLVSVNVRKPVCDYVVPAVFLEVT